jgi:hypothetical protein
VRADKARAVAGEGGAESLLERVLGGPADLVGRLPEVTAGDKVDVHG